MPPFKGALLVLSVCGVTILNIFVNGALVVALPTIGKELNFSEAELQWPLNVYALSYGSLLLVAGRVADIVGSKRMFLCGTAWFALWSLATALAPNKVTLIVFVAMIGVGAATNTPTGIGIFSAHFKPGPTKNRAIAALGAGQSVGYITGLVLGGFLCQSKPGWRIIFYIQSGLAALFFILGVRTLPTDPIERRYTKGIDWVGALLSAVGVGLLTYSLSESTAVRRGWRTPWIPCLFVLSLLILLAFLFWESRRERQGLSIIMPLSLWTKPGAMMRPVVSLVFLAWSSYNSLSYFVTLYFQQINFLDPLQTSLRLVPSALSSFSINIVTGLLLAKVPGEWLILTGLIGTTAASLIFALIDVHSSYWSMAFLVMIFVSCAEVAYTVANLQISTAFDDDSQALAGGIFNVATRLGTSFGLALSSSVSTAVSNSFSGKHPALPADSPLVLEPGFRVAGWVCFALAAASVAIALFGTRGMGRVGRKAHLKVPDADVTSAAFEKDKTEIVDAQVPVLTLPFIS